jgi:hypothetical protein
VISRRSVIAGLFAAPAIVAVENIMPIRVPSIWLPSRNVLTLNMITREAIRLFVNSNNFLKQIDEQFSEFYSPPTGARLAVPTWRPA